MEHSRYLASPIQKDLQKKMVFLAGPRQAGKHTLAKKLLGQASHGEYFLWDNRDDRKRLMKAQWPPEPSLVVLDELHKYRHWKRWLKGEFDKYRSLHHFLVTGSGRMDVYRRGGDSLQGRYHHYRLHPFTLNEMHKRIPKIEVGKPLNFIGHTNRSSLDDLMRFSGFPEPLWEQNERAHRRWQKEHIERVVREDVRDLENVRDISLLQLLVDLLPERAANLLSLNSMREDLEVSHRAITHWMEILEKLYFVFRIRPYHSSKIRGLKKEAKLYLWDWTQISDEGKRFENLIASHLLKFCHYLEDTEGYSVNLHYLRDPFKREVDFLVTIENKPWFAVEAKTSGPSIAPNLWYFGKRLHIPYLFQAVLHGQEDFVQEGVRSIPAHKFLTGLI